MTQQEIIDRLKVVQTEIDKYFAANQGQGTVDGEEVKIMSPRAYDTLVTEQNRLTRALAS